MAEEGNSLHDPWAPPSKAPDDDVATPAGPRPESDVPTRATPLPPAPEPPVAPPPPLPEPVLYDAEAESGPDAVPKRRWPGSAKAAVIVLALLLVATAAGLGYAWWKTNDEKKDLETAANQQGQELSQQLSKANQTATSLQQNLDATNKQVADLQQQLDASKAAATQAAQQADAMKALFPVDASTVSAGLPGTYRSDPLPPQPGGCSLASCPTAPLTLTIEGGNATLSDPALGRVALRTAGAGWSATGPVTAPLQLQCGAAPQATTFTVQFSAAAVALDSAGKTQVTTVAGSLLLTSAAVPAGVDPGNPTGCPPGVASYVFAANRT